MAVDREPGSGARWRTRAASAGSGATAATRTAAGALAESVGALADSAIDRVLLTDERVTSASEAKRLLAGEADTEALADKVQRVVILAVPFVRVLARGARLSRVPWVMVASSSVSIGIAVRAGVRELQLLASLLACRLEQATGAPPDAALVKKVAIDLYLHPRRAPDPADEKLRLLRLTRIWVLRGAFGRDTSRRAAKAFDAAEKLDGQQLAARWETAASLSTRQGRKQVRTYTVHGPPVGDAPMTHERAGDDRS
jgi:hypothetical protein